MASIYKLDYDGQLDLQHHDAHADLRRWFDNYKVDGDQDCRFADDHEWLTIEEKKFRGARRSCVRYVGTIGDVEMLGPRRTVVFETNAPPPPTFHRPAKFRPAPVPRSARYSDPRVAPPPSTVDLVFEAMERLGIPGHALADRLMGMRDPSALLSHLRFMEEERKLRLEYVRMSAMNWILPLDSGVIKDLDLSLIPTLTTAPVLTPIPPPKRYRRNV